MKIHVILFALIVSSFSLSQETKKDRISEYHFVAGAPLKLSELAFGFDYKRQIGERMFLKLSALSLRFNSNESSQNSNGSIIDYETLSYSGGLGIGLEFRYPLNDRLTFYHGPNISGSYAHSQENTIMSPISNDYDESDVFTAAIPYTFGFMVSLKHNIYLSAFLSPGVTYEFYQINNNNGSSTEDRSRIYFGLSDQISGISIAIRR